MSTELITMSDALRKAQRRFTAQDSSTNDWAKWVILAAAIFGIFMLTRAFRRIFGMAIGLFWVWFWTHGAWRHFF